MLHIWFDLFLMRSNHEKNVNGDQISTCLVSTHLWYYSRGVGTCVRVGGQKTWILRKTPYFSAILVNFYQKWGGSCPPCPPGSYTPVSTNVEPITMPPPPPNICLRPGVSEPGGQGGQLPPHFCQKLTKIEEKYGFLLKIHVFCPPPTCSKWS